MMTSFLIFSNYEHLQHDLVAIHGLVCPLLPQARKPLPHANSREERLEMKQQQQKTRVSSAFGLLSVCMSWLGQ